MTFCHRRRLNEPASVVPAAPPLCPSCHQLVTLWGRREGVQRACPLPRAWAGASPPAGPGRSPAAGGRGRRHGRRPAQSWGWRPGRWCKRGPGRTCGSGSSRCPQVPIDAALGAAGRVLAAVFGLAHQAAGGLLALLLLLGLGSRLGGGFLGAAAVCVAGLLLEEKESLVMWRAGPGRPGPAVRGQSSSGSIKVMAGAGSSTSTAPAVAINLVRRAGWVSELRM